MCLRFPTPSRKLNCSLFLLITIFLLSDALAAQDPRKTQDEATRLMGECLQLVQEGLPASLSKAIDKCESARSLFHSLNIPAGEGAVLMMTGFAYSQLDQDQKAIESYEQSASLFRAANIPKGEAASLLHLGLIQGKLGEWQKAMDTFDKALPLFRASGETEGEVIALAVMGSIHVQLGKPEELLNYYAKVLEVVRATGSREGEAAVLTALGPIYAETGQPEKARESLEQALSVYRALGFRRGEAAALLMLALFYSYQVDRQKALAAFRQALPLLRTEHDRFGEGVALGGLCVTQLIASEYKEGLDTCYEAQALVHAIGDRPNEAFILKHLAIAERNRGNLAAALTAVESAIAIIESLRTNVINPELRLSYFEGSQATYEFYIDLLMLLHRQNPNKGYDGKALEASERARARLLLETLTEASADIRQGVDASLLQRERDIQRRLNAKARLQMQSLSLPQAETQTSAVAEEIQTLLKELQRVETEIRQTSPHYAALMQPRPLTLKEIQTQVLDPDTMLLEYSLGEERSYLWVVTSSSINSHVLPKDSEIETAARRFYDRLNARNVRVKGETNAQRENRVAQADAEISEAAAFLSRMVLGPVAPQLGNRRLMIVADGALHFVPFAALTVASRGVSRPLIADHEIVNLPSASTLSVIRAEIAGRQKAPRSLAALADPVFMKNDERVKRNGSRDTSGDRPRWVRPPARGENAKDRQLVKAAAEDTGVATDGLYIPRLPGTRQEAEQIVAMIPPADRRLALDFAASRETAMSAELGQYRYVHFSTHGFLNSVHPELSGVVFSLINERGEEQEGFLRAHELFNLKLPAEVVVLSACQTGMGKNIKGEGLVSLTRGFMYAGAPRVVVSLWGVSDVGTTELMVRFYQKMLQGGMRPAAALRAAQLSLMNDKRWASPYYWAPFTLQGEWR
jgi:CHAT domain-containing protein/tetratricopeptide (TPR) repeat protein